MNEKTEYLELNASKIEQTVLSLTQRISERFPESGLLGVAQKTFKIAQRAHVQAERIANPIVSLRILIGCLILLIFVAVTGSLINVNGSIGQMNLLDFAQALEAGINDVVLIAIAIFFLASLERRVKRHRALKAIHELRAIAHIIDMHQLTKDPARMLWESKGLIEPRKQLTPFQLSRYLDYCSEMLSLVGKISVLYVQNFDDPVALSAVNEVESLTTGLSRKIWQKLMIIQRHDDCNSLDKMEVSPQTHTE